MAHSVIMRQPGGPDVLEWSKVSLIPPAPGELQLVQSYAGLNFADLLHRSGQAPLPLPAVIGVDGVGRVRAIGEGISGYAEGDRIVYTMFPGAYCEVRNIPASRAVRVPDDIDDETAVALISKGLTARYLLKDLRTFTPGDTILVHSAAGGVGSLLSQWAAALGIVVIGTVSSASKIAAASRNGCAHVIVRGAGDLASQVSELTHGAKVSSVFDSVGRETFTASLDCLRPRGLMVCFGATSGMPGPFGIEELGRRGALMLTQPGLMPFIASEDQLASASLDLWQATRERKITAHISKRFALSDAAAAHREFEEGQSTGAWIFKA
jgi:NADPH:quinone reductase